MAVLNKDYDFVTVFTVINQIQDESRSTEAIWNALNQSLTSKQLRNIIIYGIKQYYTNTNDFSIVKNIHDTLITQTLDTINSLKSNVIVEKEVKQEKKEIKHKYNVNTNISTNSHTKEQQCSKTRNHYNYIGQAFKNTILKRFIFQFLNFKSLINCCKVNTDWFYDSYHQTSIYHIKLNHLFSKSKRRRGVPIVWHMHYANILRFKNVSSIEITLWESQNDELNNYLQSIATNYLKIEKIRFSFDRTYSENVYNYDYDYDTCYNIIKKLIVNNSHHN